jgi:hypothetical protein
MVMANRIRLLPQTYNLLSSDCSAGSTIARTPGIARTLPAASNVQRRNVVLEGSGTETPVPFVLIA